MTPCGALVHKPNPSPKMPYSSLLRSLVLLLTVEPTREGPVSLSIGTITKLVTCVGEPCHQCFLALANLKE
jgi:hypothetical protein